VPLTEVTLQSDSYLSAHSGDVQLPSTGWKIVLLLVRYLLMDRAIAQAVSRRLPTLAARVRAQVRLYGICVGQTGIFVYFVHRPVF
jgi:hypothetical protein